MKQLAIILFVIMIMSCALSDSQKTIDPGDVYEDQPEISCMQKCLKDHDVFQPQFVLDMESPELTIYAKGSYAKLSDTNKDKVLESVGREWRDCYPDDFRPLTLWLKDKNDMIITVIFVTKD